MDLATVPGVTISDFCNQCFENSRLAHMAMPENVSGSALHANVSTEVVYTWCYATLKRQSLSPKVNMETIT